MKRQLISLVLCFGFLSVAEAAEPLRATITPSYADYDGRDVFVLCDGKQVDTRIYMRIHSPFYCVVTNISKRPIVLRQILSDWDECISLIIEDSSGRKYRLAKKPKGWDSNVPLTWVLKPQQSFIAPIFLTDGTWEGIEALIAAFGDQPQNDFSHQRRIEHVKVSLRFSVSSSMSVPDKVPGFHWQGKLAGTRENVTLELSK